MNIFEIHSKPVGIVDLKINLKEIKSFIKNNDFGPTIFWSNKGGFHSRDINTSKLKDNKTFLKIKNLITKNVNLFSKDILRIKEDLKMQNIWLNINSYKDYNAMHSHSDCTVSGCLYIKVPKNSGQITFNPDLNLFNYMNQNTILNWNKYNSRIWQFEPKEGQLFLFPSWLLHSVEPNLNKKEKRIGFAFNYI